MKNRNLYIHTIGCQMNVYDSGQMVKQLALQGYRQVSSPEQADLIISNTCAIREKAEQKVFSFLGRLASLKRRKPSLIIAVGGCVAQQEGKKIIERMPHVDLVFGTHAISRLSGLIRQVELLREPVVAVEMSDVIDESHLVLDAGDNEGVSRFVTIMQGCDNFCTYCVVPYVRGRENSRKPDNIVKEIRQAVASGAREVTLLGQNVNSYGKKEHLCSFPELLESVCHIEGLSRVRFTTSHPKDLSAELICAFRDLDRLCKHFHLPVQSGSNQILKRMNRKYTRETYLEKVQKLRAVCPDIAISSDFIVGFPGESRDDFEQTLDLVRTVEYDSLFVFKYSDRPNAPAADYPDKIPDDEKNERLHRLLELQEEITVRKHEALVGTIQQVLVEGLSKKQPLSNLKEEFQDIQWSGRSSGNKIVNFSVKDSCRAADEDLTGKLMYIRIQKACSHSLWGQPVEEELKLPEVEGEDGYYAA